MALKAVARWDALLVLLILGGGVWSWTLSPYFLNRANLLDLATPYIFIGLLVTVFFAAALSSKAGELNALGSTTTVVPGPPTVSAKACARRSRGSETAAMEASTTPASIIALIPSAWAQAISPVPTKPIRMGGP